LGKGWRGRVGRRFDELKTLEELFKTYASHVALLLEAVAAIVITVGAVGAVIKLINPAGKDPARPFRRKKMIWLRFGVWLLLGLEFELAAVIRTFPNYFLERDVERYGEEQSVGD
jgi:uncharacterized membrane protein